MEVWWESRKACPKYCVNCCDSKSSENSLVDKWSITHIMWGAVFSIPVFYIRLELSFVLTLVLSILYEVVENTLFGHAVARCICCSDFYEGDNFWNSVVDVFFNMVGWLILALLSQ